MNWHTVAALNYQRTVAEHGARLVVALLVLGLVLSGGAAATFLSPPTVERTEHADRQQVRTDVRTEALVTGETSLYERGTLLEDQPLYLTAAAPNLTVSVRTTVSDDRRLTASQELALRYTARSDDEVFWSETEVLGRSDDSASDGAATVTATVSVPDVYRRVAQIRDDVGSAGDVRVELTHAATYETDRYEGNATAAAPLALSAGSYAVDGGLEWEETHSTPVTAERPDPAAVFALSPGGARLVLPHLSVLLGALGAVSFAGAAYTARLHRRRPDAAAVARRLDRRRFAEWISEGRLPSDVGAHTVPLSSLADLVDVGIDANRRVVYDPDRGVYGLVDDGVFYCYELPSPDSQELARP